MAEEEGMDVEMDPSEISETEKDTQKNDELSSLSPTVQNVVSTANLSCKLDLKTIALRARNAEYNPKRFAAAIMRIREPKSTALIFASGKMVCAGARSEEASKLAARKDWKLEVSCGYLSLFLLWRFLAYQDNIFSLIFITTNFLWRLQYARIIQKLGFPAVFKDFKITNIVGSCDVKFPIRLEFLARAHEGFCQYEPEIFPGMVYRMKQPKVCLLIFVSGKIVFTGAKTRDDIEMAFRSIYPVVSLFKKVAS